MSRYRSCWSLSLPHFPGYPTKLQVTQPCANTITTTTSFLSSPPSAPHSPALSLFISE